jgi:hypothetical protein
MTLHDTRLAVMLPFHVNRAKKLPIWCGVTDVIHSLPCNCAFVGVPTKLRNSTISLWRTEGEGLGGSTLPPPKFRNFDKADPNSQFRGKHVHP